LPSAGGFMNLLLSRVSSAATEPSMARSMILAARIALTFVLLLGAASWFCPAGAQTTSTILGTVTDKQGLAITGADLKLVGDTVATSRETTADANGSYQFPGVPAGIYKLTASHSGFTTRVF